MKLLDRSLPVQSVHTRWLQKSGVALDILRLDLLHPLVSGNKWFKQKFHIQAAQDAGIDTVLSFGGAWSNHIHALAASGHLLGFNTVGVIRGEHQPLSAMLKDVMGWGMRLHFVSRSNYRRRYEADYQQSLLMELGYQSSDIAIIPEGGGGRLGVKGCEEILPAGKITPGDYDEIWLACGTGATLAGIARSAGQDALIRGIAVLKGGGFLQRDINELLGGAQPRWLLETAYHCGGYARTTPELLDFIKQFELDTDVPLDQVYTGKVMLALKQQIGQGLVEHGSRILMVHTGGLQGKRGIKQ